MASPGRRARARLGELLIPARNTRQAGGAYRMPPPQPGPRHTHRPPNPLPFAGPETPERKSPQQSRVAFDERSPAAALARGHARNRPRRNLILRRFRFRNSDSNSMVRLRDHPEVVVVDSRRAAGRAAAREANRIRMFGRGNNNSTDQEESEEMLMSLRPRVLSEGDLRIHPINQNTIIHNHPEPDSRRRASTAAAEVRAARAANLAAREEASARARATADAIASLRAREVAVYETGRRAALFGCSHESLVYRETTLLRRANASGAAGSDVARRLGELRSERIVLERVWANELDKIAEEVDELPVRDATCVICLCKIIAGEVVIRLPCFHVYHYSCIFDYLRKEENPTCPIDRCPVPKNEVLHLPVWRWGEE